MLFWIYMTCCALLIPVSLFGFGYYFRKKAPNNINIFFGYRTSRSMKNNETWIFAHKYCGKIWINSGIVLFIISILAMFFALGKDTDTVGYVGAGCSILSIFTMIVSIILTENALRRNFNQFGHRIKNKDGKNK